MIIKYAEVSVLQALVIIRKSISLESDQSALQSVHVLKIRKQCAISQ